MKELQKLFLFKEIVYLKAKPQQPKAYKEEGHNTRG